MEYSFDVLQPNWMPASFLLFCVDQKFKMTTTV